MTGEESRIRVIVKSKSVPVGMLEPNYGANAVLGYSNRETKKRLIIQNVLDREQEKLVNDVSSLGNMLGIQVEIIDLGKENAAKRLFRTLSGRTIKAPSVIFPMEVWSGFDSSAILFQMISKKQPLDYQSVIELISNHLRAKYEFANQKSEKPVHEELVVASN